MSGFSAEKFLSRCTKDFVGNPSVLTFRKFMVAKNFIDKKREAVSIFSVEKFSSHIAGKFH